MDEGDTWGLEAGAEIAPGRSVLARIGGSELYDTYLVWDSYRFAVMVAKLLRPDQVEHSGAQRALEREVRALAALSHPVVVRAFDAVLDGPRPHVLLEHLDGPTLGHLIRRQGALPVEQLLPVALHLASALHYFENARFVHLDVKPDNVIVGLPPRLIDLSLARPVDDTGRFTEPVGTDAYMAPEQCEPRARGAIGPPADVWGLGATVYHAVSGSVPFPREPGDRDGPPERRFPQLVQAPIGLTDPLPSEVIELIYASLEAEPSNRPSAEQFALGLQPLVAELPQRFTLTKAGWRMR